MVDRDFEAEVEQEVRETRLAEPYEEDELIGIQQVSNRAYRNGDVFFVRSASLEAKFYRIADGVCMCPGFQFRGDCNHLRHLEKEGWLVHDSNGDYRMGDGGNVRRSRDVVTGERSVPDHDPVANQLGGQVLRLQDLVKAQDRLIVAQRRLIGTMKNQSSQAMMFRALHAVEVESQNVRNVESQLMAGDAVELDV